LSEDELISYADQILAESAAERQREIEGAVMHDRAARVAEEAARVAQATVGKFRATSLQHARNYDAAMAQARARDLRVPRAAAEVLQDHPELPLLQIHFARYPEVVDKLFTMSPAQQGREVESIAKRLLPQPKTRSSAPPPPRTPKGGAAPPSQDADLTN